MLTVDLIVCTMEEMKAMGAPMASLFGEAEPRTLDVATSSEVIPDTWRKLMAIGLGVQEKKLGRGAAK